MSLQALPKKRRVRCVGNIRGEHPRLLLSDTDRKSVHVCPGASVYPL